MNLEPIERPYPSEVLMMNVKDRAFAGQAKEDAIHELMLEGYTPEESSLAWDLHEINMKGLLRCGSRRP